MTPGALVAIEGIDGSGKRSVCDAILERSRANGLRALHFTFPNYDSCTGVAITEYLETGFPLTPEAAAMLFACDRLADRDRLLSALAASELVIVDRYVDSNAAYQAARVEEGSREDFVAWVRALEFGVMGMPRPSVSILLDLSIAESRRRTTHRASDGRPETDHYESSSRLLAIASHEYRRLAHEGGWRVIEAEKLPREDVADAVWGVVLGILRP